MRSVLARTPIPSGPPSWPRSQLSSVAVSDRLGQATLPVGECVCFLTESFFEASLAWMAPCPPLETVGLADLFLGRPRSRRYPKFLHPAGHPHAVCRMP